MWPPTTTDCECEHAGWCDRHQCWKPAELHRACRRIPALFQRWENGTGPQLQNIPERSPPPPEPEPCIHRGQRPVDALAYRCCGGRVISFDIFDCVKHGQCTELICTHSQHSETTPAACRGCDDYEAPDDHQDQPEDLPTETSAP